MSKMLLTDLYMITMGQGYFDAGKKDEVGNFEVFFRRLPKDTGFAISCGLRNVIQYLKEFGFSKGDIDYFKTLGQFSEPYLDYLRKMKFECDLWAVPDGTVVFANEPVLRVRGPIIQAQLLEAAFLMYMNHASTIATRAARMSFAARGRSVIEQGPRSKHGESAAIEGAAHAFVGGCVGTSCVATGKLYGIPLYGTMAHSFVKSFDTEAQAFESYLKSFPDTSVFLLDSDNTLESGLPSAIKAASGKKLYGVRLDSGDFGKLSISVRTELDKAGMESTKIIASGALDEYKIDKLVSDGATIDTFGIGENLTGSNGFGIGMVYKLCAIQSGGLVIPKMKISEAGEKASLPGVKMVCRSFDKKGKMVRDVIALEHEKFKGELISVRIFEGGKLVYDEPSLVESKNFCEENKARLPEEFKLISNPNTYQVELSGELLKLREGIMKKEVLVVIDMVNGFVKFGALHSPLVDKITPKIVEYIKDFKSRNKQVIAFCDCHAEDDEEFKTYPPHCIKGTAEAELIPEIAIFKKDMKVFNKNSTDGMAMTDIREYFINNVFDVITIVGCCTDICVQQFAIGLRMALDKISRSTEIVVPRSAVATFDLPSHNAKEANKKALALMQSAGIKIL